MTNALQVYNDGGFETMQRTAQAMVKSGYFSDAKDLAQAVVKVMAGAELGLPPFAAMTGIHVIKGKPTLGANLMASLIKGSGKYNYRVIEHTDKVCRIVFYENGEKAGESVFTAADAQRAGVQNMGKYPKNMLFARAISNGARWHCPDVFSGTAVYTAEELGANVDEDGDVVYEGSYETVDTETGEIVEPDEIIEDETAVSDTDTASAENNQPKATMTVKPTATMTKRFHALGTEIYGSKWEEKRPQLVSSVTKGRSESSKHLERGEMEKLINGMEEKALEKSLDEIEDKHHG